MYQHWTLTDLHENTNTAMAIHRLQIKYVSLVNFRKTLVVLHLRTHRFLALQRHHVSLYVYLFSFLCKKHK